MINKILDFILNYKDIIWLIITAVVGISAICLVIFKRRLIVNRIKQAKAFVLSKINKPKVEKSELDDLDFVSLSVRLLYVVSKTDHTDWGIVRKEIQDFLSKYCFPSTAKRKLREADICYANKSSWKIVDLTNRIVKKDIAFNTRVVLLDYMFKIAYNNGFDLNTYDYESVSNWLEIDNSTFRYLKNRYKTLTLLKKKEGSSPNKGTVNHTKFQLLSLTIALMAEAMKVDRSKLVCELDAIKEYIYKNARDNFKNRVNEVKKYLDNPYDISNVDSICEKIKDYPYSSREEVLKALLAVVYADETCDPTELNFLEHVAENLNVITSDLDNLRMKFEAKRQRKERKRLQEEARRRRKESRQNGGYQKDESQSSQPLTIELEKAYAALGIDKDATDREVKACWRNLQKIYHPDMVARQGVEEVEKAKILIQEINTAFALIKKSRGMK